jgi:hypothetical protein
MGEEREAEGAGFHAIRVREANARQTIRLGTSNHGALRFITGTANVIWLWLARKATLGLQACMAVKSRARRPR